MLRVIASIFVAKEALSRYLVVVRLELTGRGVCRPYQERSEEAGRLSDTSLPIDQWYPNSMVLVGGQLGIRKPIMAAPPPLIQPSHRRLPELTLLIYVHSGPFLPGYGAPRRGVAGPM